MLKLFHAATSVCSQKVRVGLAEIGLAYDSVLLDLPKGEQFRPDYLALNPDAVVPTLVDGDLVLVESSLILEYLDREYNKSRLMPAGRAEEAAARHWLLRAIAIHAAINSLTFSTVMRSRILAEQSPEEIAENLARMPDPVMRLKRRDLFEKGLDSPYVQQALVHLRRTFSDMAAALETNRWISGAQFGISDIALVAYVNRLDLLAFNGLWEGEYRAVAAWLAAMRERPSHARGIADHLPEGAVAMYRSGGEAAWPDLRRKWRET